MTEVPYVVAVIVIDGIQPVTLTIASGAIVKFKAGGRIDIAADASIANFDDITYT